MGRLLYAILVGLVGAGIIHIAVLFLLPRLTERDAWAILSESTGFYTVTDISGARGQAPLIGSTDPLFEAVACRFDLAEGIAHLRGDGSLPFWSVSVYDRSGQNLFSFTDRTADERRLDVAVLSPVQMVEVRKDTPQAFRQSIFVEADLDEAIIVLRVFVPDESWRPQVARFLSSVSCRPE
jgi:uncharacterized membrane protein